MYPVTIADNFFDEPDKIVDYAMKQTLYPNEDGRWPGSRSDQIVNFNRELFDYTCMKICTLHHTKPLTWNFEMSFQLITPFSKHQYDTKNRGWVHVDKGDTVFGGIIYLNKNPEKDTGTSIFGLKNGWVSQQWAALEIKEKHYRGEEVSDEEHEAAWHMLNDQFVETVSIENVYNRLVLFNCNTFHGVKTFGKNQDRLTISFFCRHLPSNDIPPYYR